MWIIVRLFVGEHVLMARKLLFCFSVLALFILSIPSVFCVPDDTIKVGYLRINPGESQLIIKENNIVINAWDSYGVTYFFIPSYARISSLSYSLSESKLYSLDGDVLLYPEFNSVQDVLVGTEDGEKVEHKVSFCQSANMYSLYIDTEGFGIDNVSREEYIPADISILSPEGICIYNKKNELLKGRGNWTFMNAVQKSYQIKLSEDVSIAGLPQSDLWALLPSLSDRSRLCNKLAMDTSAAMGMEYAIESDWIDVFIDGLYWGNYLICHEPDIGIDDFNIENLEKQNKIITTHPDPVDVGSIKAFNYPYSPGDISGGYLFCLDQYPEYRSCGFFLSDNLFFKIKSPDNASLEEAEYIHEFVNTIDQNVHKGSDEEIDFHSFARRYIIDELFMNWDSSKGSCYFYKKPNSDIIYAGPCWDYDFSLISSENIDLTQSVLTPDFGPGDENRLDWNRELMNNEAYRAYVEEVFHQYFWLWDDLISRQIDSDYEKASDSLYISYLRWIKIEEEVLEDVTNYPPPDFYYDTLKSNLSLRLEYLSERWSNDNDTYAT